jgi:hypothetical protein
MVDVQAKWHQQSHMKHEDTACLQELDRQFCSLKCRLFSPILQSRSPLPERDSAIVSTRLLLSSENPPEVAKKNPPVREVKKFVYG